MPSITTAARRKTEWRKQRAHDNRALSPEGMRGGRPADAPTWAEIRDVLDSADDLLKDYETATPPTPAQVGVHLQERVAVEMARCTRLLAQALAWSTRGKVQRRLRDLQRMHADAVQMEREERAPAAADDATTEMMRVLREVAGAAADMAHAMRRSLPPVEPRPVIIDAAPAVLTLPEPPQRVTR